MNTYQVITTDLGFQFILRLSDNAFIPVDPNNKDYQQYLKDMGH